MPLWCVQEVAELKEEDIISTNTQVSKTTPTAGVSGDIFREFSKSTNEESVTFIVYSLQLRKT